jgi:hypothetical protein
MFAAQDEPLADWASRHLEREMESENLARLRDATPQTEAVPNLALGLRSYAEQFNALADEIEAGLPEEEALARLVEMAVRDVAVGRLEVDPAHNPPAWVADEAIWERAKEAAEGGEYEDFYAVVTDIYKKMGGGIA